MKSNRFNSIIRGTVATMMMLGFLTASAKDGDGDHAKELFTREGSDPSFEEVLASEGVTAGNRQSSGPVRGSRVHVNHELLEKQVGKTGPIPKDIAIHTEVRSGIRRKDFAKWSRWYQEDGNTQVFRLFEGEQNVRGGVGENGSPGRTEAHTGKALKVAPGKWREWEGTYTIVKPLVACIFQLFHEGKEKSGRAILWPFHIDMSAHGDIHFLRRRSVQGEDRKIVMATDMTGKSLSVKVRADGEDYEVYKKLPLDKDWTLVTTGSYLKADDNKISFRWGMYAGSKKGHRVPNDGMLFVTGVTIR